MKFFTPPALLAAALLSVVVALPFLPAAKLRPNLFVLEAQMTATAGGTLQVFYDDDHGLREDLSGRAAVTPTAVTAKYRLPIPPGRYGGLRLDPPERGATIVLTRLRVLAPGDRVVAEIPLDGFQPRSQIAALQFRDGALTITSVPNGDDPQTVLALPAPIVVTTSWRDHVRASVPFVAPVFIGLALLLFVLERAPRVRAGLAQRARALAARPRRAVALAAAVAVVASAYPVVFLGKSHVSPNLGTVLLYDTFPTLPGYRSAEVADVKLSDIGAIMWQHVPYSMMQHRALAHGELPLWNRYNAAGVPLLAQGQSMFGDPLHFLVIAANGAAWAWDVKYLVAKWLFALGLGLTVLAVLAGPKDQKTGAPEASSLVAALLVAAAAPFIGFFLYRVNHPAFFSLCYAPWPLYCLVRIAQAPARRGVALWSAALVVANLALMNSGTVKEAYMLLVSVNLAGACVLVVSDALWRERLAKLAALAWAGALFALITLPIWATFLQTLKNAYTGYNVANAYQIQPTLLLGAFDEIFYRPLLEQNNVFGPSLNVLLLLGLLYFLATLRLHFANRAALVLAACSLVPLSLAFGLVPPRWILAVPFLSNIAHLDNTFSCVLIVLWSIVAGVGFAAAARRLGTAEGRGDLVSAALLLFALVFGWIAFRQAAHRVIYGPTFSVHRPGEVLAVHPFLWGYLLALLLAVLLLAWLTRGALVRRACGPARGLLLAGCIAALLWRHGLHAQGVGFENFTSRPTDRVDFHAKSDAMELVRAAQAREPSRGFGLEANFFPGWTGVYGLETIHGPDALVNPWLRELVGVSGVERLWDWRLHADAKSIGQARPFFDALNVRYYFDRASDPDALGKALTLVRRADLDVYESPTVWPRAFFTDRVDVYDQPAELIARIREARGRPLAAAQRSDAAAQAALGAIFRDTATRTVTPATNYTLTENATTFTVHADGPGVVVLTEALWPGDSRATIDGHDAPVVRLNHAFKGVVVPAAGDYRISFRYWPRKFTRNLALSALGAALGLVSLALALRPARTA